LENQKIIEIFHRYLDNRCTEEETRQLVQYFNASNDILLRQLILKELENPEVIADDEKLQQTTHDVFNFLKTQIKKEDLPVKGSYFNSFTKFAVAASLLIVASIGLYFYPNKVKVNEVANTSKYKNDIAPGENKAVLTLANGKRIALNDTENGELEKQQEGLTISKTTDGQLVYHNFSDSEDVTPLLNILETPNGGQYQVRLADGTKVWLNAASKLTYPATFKAAKTRIVELSGEAYFEVAKNASQPFIVKTIQQDIKVLGTQFNVMAYGNEAYQETTLIEGSVKVSAKTQALDHQKKGAETSRILVPGQQARILPGANTFNVASNIDTDAVTAWKEGVFFFDQTPLHTVMQQVERWYNTKVIYEGEEPNISISGILKRSNNLSKLLDMLELASGVKFNIEGNKVIVLKLN
jgi:transmembrane sensor